MHAGRSWFRSNEHKVFAARSLPRTQPRIQRGGVVCHVGSFVWTSSDGSSAGVGCSASGIGSSSGRQSSLATAAATVASRGFFIVASGGCVVDDAKKENRREQKRTLFEFTHAEVIGESRPGGRDGSYAFSGAGRKRLNRPLRWRTRSAQRNTGGGDCS